MPPKRKNKPSRNGYWQFVMELKDKPQNRGRNMDEIQQMAAAKWGQMNAEQRAPYGQRADYDRNNYAPEKLTSDRIPIQQIEREEKEAEEEIQMMKEGIESTVRLAKLTDSLDEEFFVIVHVNHLVYYPTHNRYFICELAAAAFNLRSGVQLDDVFHAIVYPGKLPLGYYGTALTHSKETHQLVEIVLDNPDEKNVEQVFHDFLQYLDKYKKGDDLPVLYTTEKTMEMTKNVFRDLRDEFNCDKHIKIYNLQYLLYILRNSVAERTVWHSESLAYNEIDKDVYSLVPDIACDYHEGIDVIVYCSRSIVIRYGFTICDICCSDMGIALVPGLHVPDKSQVDSQSNLTSRATSMSSISSIGQASFRPKSSCSLVSGDFDHHFPALGGGRSNVSTTSSMTWRSLRTPKSDDNESLAESFNSVSLRGRDHSKLKMPARRFH